MRWQLGGDWPVGARCIPAATIISAGEAPNYQAIPLAELPKPLPLNAEALDEDAALQMLYWHPPELWHRPHRGHRQTVGPPVVQRKESEMPKVRSKPPRPIRRRPKPAKKPARKPNHGDD